MRISQLFKAALVGAAVWLSGAAAWAMSVSPIVVDLRSAGRTSAQVTVENGFTQPLPVELRAQLLEFKDNTLTPSGQDSGEILVFPPQAIIQPGQRQVFRFQWVGAPELAASKSFYVTVAQQPVAPPEGESVIQILYNFQVLASVAPAQGRADISVERAAITKNAEGKPVASVTLKNASNVHGYFGDQRFRIIQKDANGREVFRRLVAPEEVAQLVGVGLVPGNASRTLSFPFELPSAEGELDVRVTADARRRF